MKFLTIVFFLLSFNSFAGYMSKADMLSCAKANRTFYMKKKMCDQSHADCTQVPKDFLCDTYSDLDTQVPDTTKPTFSKNEVEACSSQADCESKNAVKTCIDLDEKVLMAADFSEIYCSKQTGFQNKTVKQVREDPAKKSSWDAAKAAKAAKKAAKKAKFQSAESLMAKLNGPSALTPADIKMLLLGILEKLSTQ